MLAEARLKQVCVEANVRKDARAKVHEGVPCASNNDSMLLVYGKSAMRFKRVSVQNARKVPALMHRGLQLLTPCGRNKCSCWACSCGTRVSPASHMSWEVKWSSNHTLPPPIHSLRFKSQWPCPCFGPESAGQSKTRPNPL